jgi:hypothetical protein
MNAARLHRNHIIATQSELIAAPSLDCIEITLWLNVYILIAVQMSCSNFCSAIAARQRDRTAL